MAADQRSGTVKRYGELDALRGVAAVVVMLYHFFRLWAGTAHARWVERLFTATPLRLLVSGRAAVVLFFVLSGFVLSLPRLEGVERGYGRYLAKRVCRIYLPYLFALGLAVLGCWRWHGATEFGGWFALTWYEAPRRALVLAHVLFLGNYDDAAYNTAFWSLVQEMRISLVFPLLFWAVMRMRVRWALWVPPVLTVITGVTLARTDLPEQVVWTANYAGAFTYGVLLAGHRDKLERWLGRLGRAGYAGFAAAALLLFMAPDRASRVMLGLGPPAVDLVMMWGAAGVLLLALSHQHVLRVLRGRLLQVLGRMSYSVYLLHGTVLFALVYAFAPRYGVTVLLGPYLVLTLLGGWAMFWVVERPAMLLGRRLARSREPQLTSGVVESASGAKSRA